VKKWLAYWCNEGFECLKEVTEYEHWDQQNLVEVLSDRRPQPNPVYQLINNMTMRARFNAQRHYELYAFSSTADLELEDLQSWADTDPQSLVNWIRGNGVELHSDRDPSPRRVIV
jgi:hypothetical protein